MRAQNRRDPASGLGSSGKVKRWQERERLEPSAVWQTIAIVFLDFAFTAGLAALTVPGNTAIKPTELWIVTGTFAALAVTCFLAHWDVNRGRRTRRYELEELSPDND